MIFVDIVCWIMFALIALMALIMFAWMMLMIVTALCEQWRETISTLRGRKKR